MRSEIATHSTAMMKIRFLWVALAIIEPVLTGLAWLKRMINIEITKIKMKEGLYG